MEQLLNNIVAFFQSQEVQVFVNTILVPSGLGILTGAVITYVKKAITFIKVLLDKNNNDNNEKVEAVVSLYNETYALLKTVYDSNNELKEYVNKLEDKTKKQDILSKTQIAISNIPVTQKQAILTSLLDETNTTQDELVKQLLNAITVDLNTIKQNSEVEDNQLKDALENMNKGV